MPTDEIIRVFLVGFFCGVIFTAIIGAAYGAGKSAAKEEIGGTSSKGSDTRHD